MNNRAKTTSRLGTICSNYKILHYDVIPILFFGTNHYGNYIIGSIFDENLESNIRQYLHSLVDHYNLYKFLNKEISYLEIIKKSDALFVVEESFDRSSKKVYNIQFGDIPTDHIPTSDSYCPEFKTDGLLLDFDYDLKLHGNIADTYLIEPYILKSVQSAMKNILKQPFSILKKLKKIDLVPKVFIKAFSPESAYSTGSFNIKFSIQPKITDHPFIFLENKDLSRLVTNYLIYSTSSEIKEINQVLKKEKSESAKLSSLLDDFISIEEKAVREVKAEEDRISIKKEIRDSIERISDISDNIGINFNSIEVKHKEETLGIIDEEYKTNIDETVEIIKEEQGEVFIDQEPKPYKVHIYHLNTDTRKGNAHIKYEGYISNPKISILGADPLQGSKFTESLHSGEVIEVQAKAKRVGNKFKTFEILFEE